MKLNRLNGPKLVEGAISKRKADGSPARDRAVAAIERAMSGQPPVAEQVTAAPAPQAEAPVQAAQETPTITEGQPTTSEESQPAQAASAPTEETQVAETPQEVTQAKPSEEQPLSAQYAQLARKERAIRAKTLEFQAQQAAMKTREDALAAREASKPSTDQYISKADLVKDPLKYLTDAGVSYEQVTQQALNAPSAETVATQQYIAKLEQKLQALEDGHKTTQQSIEQAQKQNYEQAVNQIRREASSLVAKNEAFELVQATNSIDDVVELIEKTFEEDGYVMSVEDAAQQLEDYLLAETEKLVKLKKIQNRLKPGAPQKTPAPQANTQQPAIKTLTNNLGTQRPMTSRERALAVFRGEKV